MAFKRPAAAFQMAFGGADPHGAIELGDTPPRGGNQYGAIGAIDLGDSPPVRRRPIVLDATPETGRNDSEPEEVPPEMAGVVEAAEDGQEGEKGGKGGGRGAYSHFHVLVRMGLKKSVFVDKLKKAQGPFELNADAHQRLKEGTKTTITYTMGSTWATSKDNRARPSQLNLKFNAPGTSAKVTLDDFVYGREFCEAAVHWVDKYMGMNQKLTDGTTVRPIINRVLGMQLDEDGEGVHLHVGISGRQLQTKEVTVKYFDEMVGKYSTEIFGQPIKPANHVETLRAHDKQHLKRLGYICHSHLNPFPILAKGCFNKVTPEEWFGMFLKWQTENHIRIHIREVESIRNLATTGRDEVPATAEEICVRQVEELMIEGKLDPRELITAGGFVTVFKTLAAEGKTMHLWFYQQTDHNRKQVMSKALMRFEPPAPAPASYALDTFKDIHPTIWTWLRTWVLTPPAERPWKGRSPYLVVYEQLGRTGKSNLCEAIGGAMVFKNNVSWTKWRKDHPKAKFLVLDDVEWFPSSGSNICSIELQKSMLQGAGKFSITSAKGKMDQEMPHGLPAVVLTNVPAVWNYFTSGKIPWFKHNGIFVELTKDMHTPPMPGHNGRDFEGNFDPEVGKFPIEDVPRSPPAAIPFRAAETGTKAEILAAIGEPPMKRRLSVKSPPLAPLDFMPLAGLNEYMGNMGKATEDEDKAREDRAGKEAKAREEADDAWDEVERQLKEAAEFERIAMEEMAAVVERERHGVEGMPAAGSGGPAANPFDSDVEPLFDEFGDPM
jgi:hypothetical protein